MTGSGWRRDLPCGGLPWLVLIGGQWAGHPAPGAVLALCAWLLLRRGTLRQAKLFEWATVIFLLLSLGWPEPPPPRAGLLMPLLLGLLALGSVPLGRPATLDYARPMVPPAWWDNPHFLRVNRRLTLVWAGAFLAGALLGHRAETLAPAPAIATRVLQWAIYAGALWHTRRYPLWYRLHRYLPRVRAGLEPYLKAPRVRYCHPPGRLARRWADAFRQR